MQYIQKSAHISGKINVFAVTGVKMPRILHSQYRISVIGRPFGIGSVRIYIRAGSHDRSGSHNVLSNFYADGFKCYRRIYDARSTERVENTPDRMAAADQDELLAGRSRYIYRSSGGDPA